MDEVDLVVVGAGIVGLASAWQYTDRHRSARVVVLEKEPDLGRHQTGRNSGVLHSGIYYRPGSLKARTAVSGRASMVRFCEERGIPHEVCGKVIVATSPDELGRMHDLRERAARNGVEAEVIDRDRLVELEPHCAGIAGIHVPATGIVDYLAVCRTLAADLAERGVEIRYGAGVTTIDDRDDGVVIGTADGREYRAAMLLNCAGLRSDQVARRVGGLDVDARIVPFRGEYFELAPERSHLVRNLIYPVPDPRFPFLGVHFTRTIGGEVEAGPNAVLSFARQRYKRWSIVPGDLVQILLDPRFWKLATRHWRMGVDETYRSLNRRAMCRALQGLVPSLKPEDLLRGRCGIRAQAVDRKGALVDDFQIVATDRMVHVLNAPSPAATASLSIGRHIARLACGEAGREATRAAIAAVDG